jgi:hypothetical protein
MKQVVLSTLVCVVTIVCATILIGFYRALGKTIDSTGNSTLSSTLYIDYKEVTIALIAIIICGIAIFYPKYLLAIFFFIDI